MYFFLVKRYVDRYASCYLEPGFSYLWNSVCVGLMVVTWMPTWYVIWEFFILFKCIFKLGPRAGNMLQGPRYLNPALVVLVTTHRSSLLCKKAQWHWHTHALWMLVSHAIVTQRQPYIENQVGKFATLAIWTHCE